MRERRPSPAMIVAIIALVFSLAGTGVASVATISALTKKDKRKTRRIADSEVVKLAPGLSVKSAGSANTAGSASTAGSANTAASATNANLLDGHDGSCPANTFLNRGLCFDDAPRTATAWDSASDQCASAGGMLPSLDQLRPTRSLPGVNLGASAVSAHWTSDIAQRDTGAGDSTSLSALSVLDNGGILVNNSPVTTDLHAFRCVFLLVR